MAHGVATLRLADTQLLLWKLRQNSEHLIGQSSKLIRWKLSAMSYSIPSVSKNANFLRDDCY